MGVAAIADLVTANRPGVFTLLERATEKITASPYVSHVYVRGSLAAGNADRLSDLDFVAGVADERFCDFHNSLDAFMTCEFNALLPGWRDSIVAPMGGVGYVYLVETAGKLHQLDLYLVPASRAERIPDQTAACLLYASHDMCGRDRPSQIKVASLLAEVGRRPRTCVDLLVEALVLLQMVRKRVRRGQHFSAYGEWVMVCEALRDLVKTSLAPTSDYRGWYRLEEELGVTPIGRACGRGLRDLVTLAAPGSDTDLAAALDRCLIIADLAAPAAVEELSDAVESYRGYLDLS
ncbi:MAG: hypothetical protein ACRDTM_17060 [Micromonosporaceae bacterium]